MRGGSEPRVSLVGFENGSLIALPALERGTGSASNIPIGDQKTSTKKILTIVGDYVEDYEGMAPLDGVHVNGNLVTPPGLAGRLSGPAWDNYPGVKGIVFP